MCTESCANKLTGSAFKSLKPKRHVGKISCDLAKVCECLNYEVLHIKLHLYAINRTAVA